MSSSSPAASPAAFSPAESLGAPPARCDLAVVGGGIVGLAVARELTSRHPRASVCVLEREHELAWHQTGHSSGVIHSGLYYQPGSLKARLCVQASWTSARSRERTPPTCCLAVAAGADADPRIVPFRGAYVRLLPERRDLVRALIYPVPDPSLPFLGVHLTRHIDGDVTLGPTALIAGARDAYRLRTIRRDDLLETLAWRGTWRMLARFWMAGAGELHRSVSRAALVVAGARLVPELATGDVEQGFAGVRAQAVGRDGRLLDDFAFSATERALHVRNAPSPAATASIAIAREVVERAERIFDL